MLIHYYYTLNEILCKILIMNLRSNIIVIINFQLKTNNKISCSSVNQCYGVTKDPNENGYLLVFQYAENGDLHNNLSKNFKKITWKDKIESLWMISQG